MYLHPLRAHSSQPGISGNSDVDEGRVGVGDPIYGESSSVRKCDILRTVVSLGPEHGLPILRESIRRKVWYAVYAASGPLQSPTLREAGQH
jgi:hypothetical protein